MDLAFPPVTMVKAVKIGLSWGQGYLYSHPKFCTALVPGISVHYSNYAQKSKKLKVAHELQDELVRTHVHVLVNCFALCTCILLILESWHIISRVNQDWNQKLEINR